MTVEKSIANYSDQSQQEQQCDEPAEFIEISSN